MGCSSSKKSDLYRKKSLKESQNNSNLGQQSEQSKPIQLETASQLERKQIIRAIYHDDLLQLAPYISRLDPRANLLTQTKYMNAFHFAAKYNSKKAIGLFLVWIQKHDPSSFEQTVSLPDYLDRTTLGLCISFHSVDSFYEILKYAFINAQPLKFKFFEVLDHMNYCLALLKIYQSKNLFQDKQYISKIFYELQTEDNELAKELANKAAKNNLPEQLEAQYIFTKVSFTCDYLVETDPKMASRPVQAQLVTPLNSERDLVVNENKSFIKVDGETTKRLYSFQDLSSESEHAWTDWLSLPQGPLEKHLYKNMVPASDDALTGFEQGSKLYSTTSELLQNHQVYSDPDFPQTNDSLGVLSYNQITWCRPHEILGCSYNEVYLFDDIEFRSPSIERNKKVNFIVAAIAALAEYPSRIVDIFINKKVNSKGIYGLRTYVTGIPVELYIDDAIPCEKVMTDGLPHPVTFKVDGKEIWPYLLEKAWAKCFGDYSHKMHSFSDDLWEYLLGIPTLQYNLAETQINDIWEMLMDGTRQRFYMLGVTKLVTDDQIESNTCFIILSAHELNETKVVKLKGMSAIDWKGRLDKNGPFWTPEISTELGNSSQLPRTFYMTFDEFMRYFIGMIVGHYHRGWDYSHVTAESHPKHAEYFEIHTNQSSEVYFRLHQRSKKLSSQNYAPCELDVFKKEKNGSWVNMCDQLTDIDTRTVFGHQSAFVCKKGILILPKGDYILKVKVRWTNNRINRFTLSAYSSSKIHVVPVEREQYHMVTSLYALHLGYTSHKIHTFERECTIAVGWARNYFYIYAKNQGSLKWTIVVTCKDMKNIKILKMDRLRPDSLKMFLEPEHEGIALLKVIDMQQPATFNPVFIHSWE